MIVPRHEMEATKQDVLKLIENMPDDASLQDILYEIYFRAVVERGLDDIRNRRTVSHEQVVEDVARWLQSAGQ
jgi:hypothetical protein